VTSTLSVMLILNFGHGLKNIWPQPGLDLVDLLCNRAFFGQKSYKIREFC